MTTRSDTASYANLFLLPMVIFSKLVVCWTEGKRVLEKKENNRGGGLGGFFQPNKRQITLDVCPICLCDFSLAGAAITGACYKMSKDGRQLNQNIDFFKLVAYFQNVCNTNLKISFSIHLPRFQGLSGLVTRASHCARNVRGDLRRPKELA